MVSCQAVLIYYVLFNFVPNLKSNIGIVVPGLSNAPGAQHDPSNLCLLEATSGSGVACRPLLTVSTRLSIELSIMLC